MALSASPIALLDQKALALAKRCYSTVVKIHMALLLDVLMTFFLEKTEQLFTVSQRLGGSAI